MNLATATQVQLGSLLATEVWFGANKLWPGGLGDYLLGGSISLSPNTTLQLHLPLSIDNSISDESSLTNPSSATKVIANTTRIATITSLYRLQGPVGVRPVRTYSGSFPGAANGLFEGNFQYLISSLAPWNSLTNNFNIEAWVYLPSANVTINANTLHSNTIISVGGPDSGGAGFAVRNDGAAAKNNLRLCLNSGGATDLLADVNFPPDEWVHVACTYNRLTATTSDTKIYQNGVLVKTSNTYIAIRQSVSTFAVANQRLHVGSRDSNLNSIGYSASFKGYICNLKLYTGTINVVSNSDLLMAVGSKTFTFNPQSNLGWYVGLKVRATPPFPAYMEGTVTSFTDTSVTVNITTYSGISTNYNNWTLTA